VGNPIIDTKGFKRTNAEPPQSGKKVIMALRSYFDEYSLSTLVDGAALAGKDKAEPLQRFG
jgi:hypothetical protein